MYEGARVNHIMFFTVIQLRKNKKLSFGHRGRQANKHESVEEMHNMRKYNRNITNDYSIPLG